MLCNYPGCQLGRRILPLSALGNLPNDSDPIGLGAQTHYKFLSPDPPLEIYMDAINHKTRRTLQSIDLGFLDADRA